MSANDLISLGIGSPASIGKFITFGLGSAPPVTVPDVVGQSQTDGTLAIEALGLTVSVTSAYSSTVPIGLIISQNPIGGSEVAPGSNVELVVSLGEQPQQSQTSGGFFAGYDAELERRKRRKKELEALERATEQIEETTSREIAQFMRAQEAEDERRAEIERLKQLVRRHADRREELSPGAQKAYVRALAQENFSSLEALDRELARMIEEEDIALMMLLNEEP